MPERRTLRQAFALVTTTVARIWGHPENRHRRPRALALYLVWQLWERTGKRPWRLHLTPDRTLLCHPHSTIASGVLYYRLPDHMEMRFLLDYLRTGDGFIDVGANVGIYSLLASSVEGVHALGFEPSTLAYGRALANLAMNPVGDRVRIVKRAVGAQPGSAWLTVGRDALNAVVAGPGPDIDEVEPVEVVSLDTYFDGATFPPVALIKVDVEGFELEVLRGSRRLIAAHSPALIVEVNDSTGLHEILDEMGYTCWRYDPEHRSLQPSTPGQHVGGNLIALSNVQRARRRVAAGTS